MITLAQMLLRLAIAMALGALVGWEREILDKEAGVRTALTVSAGAALFTMLGLSLPYIVAVSPENLADTIARNSGYLTVVANIVLGVGFLGAGLIIHNGNRVHGLTTAAVVWVVAAIGALAGAGMLDLAIAAALLLTVVLYLLRDVRIKPEGARPKRKV